MIGDKWKIKVIAKGLTQTDDSHLGLKWEYVPGSIVPRFRTLITGSVRRSALCGFQESEADNLFPAHVSSPPEWYTSHCSPQPWGYAEAVANMDFSEDEPWPGSSDCDRSDGGSITVKSRNSTSQHRRCESIFSLHLCPWMWLDGFRQLSIPDFQGRVRKL